MRPAGSAMTGMQGLRITVTSTCRGTSTSRSLDRISMKFSCDVIVLDGRGSCEPPHEGYSILPLSPPLIHSRDQREKVFVVAYSFRISPRRFADAGVNQLTDSEQRSGWKLLFDGKSTEHGETTKRYDFRWMESGRRRTCATRTRAGDIITENKYGHSSCRSITRSARAATAD